VFAFVCTLAEIQQTHAFDMGLLILELLIISSSGMLALVCTTHSESVKM